MSGASSECAVAGPSDVIIAVEPCHSCWSRGGIPQGMSASEVQLQRGVGLIDFFQAVFRVFVTAVYIRVQTFN